MGNIRIGFIGCGGIANDKHFPGIKENDGVDMYAFCDLYIERAEKAVKEYGCEGAKAYTDYKELLADPTIDAVHVLTPNVSHCEITCAALEAGKHVLCEKPMAATTADAKRMLDTSVKTGKMLTIGYQYRHQPQNQVAKKVIEEGYIGDAYYTEAQYLRRRGVPTWGVFTDKSKQGGGPLIDIGTHALDLALYLMNNYEVEYVVGTSFEKLGSLIPELQGQTNGRGEQISWDNVSYDVEDSAFGYIKMKNGAVINLKASWAINASDDFANNDASVRICGTKGGVDTVEGRCRLNHVVAGQQSTTMVGSRVAPYIPGFSSGAAPKSKEAEIWVNALKGEGELFVTAEQSYIVTRILDAIYESSKTGKAIYFND